MNVARLLCTLLFVSATPAFGGCARIHETRTARSYEDAKVTHREHLADEGLLQLAARQDGTRLEVKLAEVQLCRDEVSVSRGVEVTTRRQMHPRTKAKQWITFGSFAAATIALWAVAEKTECDPQAIGCLDVALAYAGSMIFGVGALISGGILLGNSAEEAETSKRIERGSETYRRLQVCRHTPKGGVRVAAMAGGTRGSGITDNRGMAHLDLALRLYPQQETTVEWMLDDVKLGSVPVSSQWRSWLIRRNAR